MNLRSLCLLALAIFALAGCSIIEKEMSPSVRRYLRPSVGDGRAQIAPH